MGHLLLARKRNEEEEVKEEVKEGRNLQTTTTSSLRILTWDSGKHPRWSFTAAKITGSFSGHVVIAL